MGWLRRTLNIPENWTGKRIVVNFEAVCGYVQVFVNDNLLAEHFDNSLPFEVDITDFVEFNKKNTLMLGIRQATLFDIPGKLGSLTYPSGSPWNMQMIGVWQDVFLRALPLLRVDNIAIRPLVDLGVLELEITVRNNTANTQEFDLSGEIKLWINEAGEDILSAPEPKWSLGESVVKVKSVKGSVGPKMITTITVRQKIGKKLKYWTPETPNLYGLILDITNNNHTVDRFYERFGWRQWGIKGTQVTLNGEPYQLRGDSAHLLGVQFLTRRFAWSWYHALKLANGNAIRLHATIRPRFYLQLADEMGIAIMDETDIWASSMNINYNVPETWSRFYAHVDGMVLRDRNYASVFGWSIANEILSALWFKGVPREFWQPIIDNVCVMADRVRALDPTRPWISSDGDGDFHGKLPTYIYHYGEPRDWARNAPKDKPFGIGEGGSMIWGSPKIFSKYNGERSYESAEGMGEGIARELYDYLVEQRKISAFCSIFTFAGSAFNRPGIGLSDPDLAPTEDDGIVFGSFVEGQSGMQPERISPYCTQFNPGYDPNLLLFNPTPVFEAVKAAYTPEEPAPCQWDHFVESKPLLPEPEAVIRAVEVIGEASSDLNKLLETCGIPVKINPAQISKMLVIDGMTLNQKQLSEAHHKIQTTLKNSGTVLVWAAQENLDLLNKLLPAPISLTEHNASNLFADREAPETAAIPLASLYFQDQSDRTIVEYCLDGLLVENCRILMKTNDFRRRRSGNSDEALFPVMIASETDSGRLLVTSLRINVQSDRRVQMMGKIFANLGVKLSETNDKYDTGFDGTGYLNQALVIGSFQGQKIP